MNKLQLLPQAEKLYCIENYTPDMIAEKLNISVNTVKTQKRKAYAFLREELQHLFVLFLMLLNL